MEELLRGVWLAGGLAALVSGGGNAAYFAGYPAAGRGQRWGAGILALVNLGVSLQGPGSAAAALSGGEAPLALACAAQAVAAAGSLAVSLAVLRRR